MGNKTDQRMKNEFGDYIRQSRIAANLSLRSVARSLDVSPSYLSEVETGKRPPLSRKRWDDLINTIPTLKRSELYRLLIKSVPIKFDLRNKSPQQQSVALHLIEYLDSVDSV